MTLSLYASGSIAGNARPSVGLHACPRKTVAVRRTRRLAVRAESGDKPKGPQEFALAPAKPKTAYGEMLQYYLKMEPQLFKAAMEDQLRKLSEEKEAKEAAEAAAREQQGDKEASASDLVLYQRMQEVRAGEMRATVEDLLYMSILEKFIVLGVEMLPRLDGFVAPGGVNLMALTEGIHTKEALELVREHLIGVMGQAASSRFSNEIIKMSKFQMAQVYAASIMFGYFLRRVDKRFQLELAMGTLGPAREDAVLRLEQLLSQAENMEMSQDPDSVPPYSVAEPSSPSSSSSAGSTSEASSSTPGSSAAGGTPGVPKKQRSALRDYVESFDQATMVETARVVSTEGAALVERQTTALFGDIKELTRQMQEALQAGGNVTSAEELYGRIQQVVATDSVETITMQVATQRRCVLEAVAFGTFLRDVEDQVQTEYHGLLTHAPSPRLPPSSGGGGGGGGGGLRVGPR